jgi:hypothetical protein
MTAMNTPFQPIAEQQQHCRGGDRPYRPAGRDGCRGEGAEDGERTSGDQCGGARAQAIGEPAPDEASRRARGVGEREDGARGDQAELRLADEVGYEKSGEAELHRRESERGERDPAQHRAIPDDAQPGERRGEKARVALAVGVPAPPHRRDGEAHRQREQRADREPRMPTVGERHRRHQHPREHAADRHAGLLDRENEVHVPSARRAAEKLRRRWIGRAVAQADHRRAEREGDQRAEHGEQAAGRDQPQAALARARRAEALREPAAEHCRHQRAAVDDRHLVADQRRARAELGRRARRHRGERERAQRSEGLGAGRDGEHRPDLEAGHRPPLYVKWHL